MDSFENFIVMIERKMLSVPLIAQNLRVLVDTPAHVELALAKLTEEQLIHVADMIHVYPYTDFAWSVLPKNREHYHPNGSQAAGDLSKLPFGDDRESVEALRVLLRQHLVKMGMSTRCLGMM